MIWVKRTSFYLLVVILLVNTFVIGSSIVSTEGEVEWNRNWSYKERLILPISTSLPEAIHQPIDIRVNFSHPCWARNTMEHSIRVCCWNGVEWYELESQIYDLNFIDEDHISSCGLVFLVPPIADGEEEYYVYYDDTEKPAPNYMDHVSIRDCHYYFEPISGLSVEGDYYEIVDDGEIVYGVGEKGQVLNRRLSQVAIVMKPGTREFDIKNSDLLASFSFAFHRGTEDKDEVSSDQRLISKEILVDGNLMVSFMLTSGSSGGELKTINIYKYYHSPNKIRRITVHVHHEILVDSHVKGIENVDGRFGALISYRSQSSVTDKMCFGEILPFLHVYSEDERVREYRLEENPECRERTWIISYEDDCDLGSRAWISYDNGGFGETHGVILSSNHGIISNASMERDGVEVKVAEREYLNIVGTEVDYVSIAFGRNSYEPYSIHDVDIPRGLVVEFDAEFITLQNGSYKNIDAESRIFQNLIKSRYYRSGEGREDIYTLTVIPHLTGRIGSLPVLRNLTGLDLPILYGELYCNETLYKTSSLVKPFIGFQMLKFTGVSPGRYVVKVYREFGNNSRRFIGVGSITITSDTTLHLYCTWQQIIKVSTRDQHGNGLGEVEVEVYKNDVVVASNTTHEDGVSRIPVPFPLFSPYVIRDLRDIHLYDVFKVSSRYTARVFYKGFLIDTIPIPRSKPSIDITIPVYDVTIEVEDKLGLPPGVAIEVLLTSNEMLKPSEIQPEYLGEGRYLFQDIPAATYTLELTYGGYKKVEEINIPEVGDRYSTSFDDTNSLKVEILNIRGENLPVDGFTVTVKREGKIVAEGVSPYAEIHLPPGVYTLNVLDESRKLIGSTLVDLSVDRVVRVVTSIYSMVFIMVTIGSFTGLIVLTLLLWRRKLSLNSYMKLVTITLVLLSLVFPWWSLHASTEDNRVSKTSYMYLYPQKMIDQLVVDDEQFLSSATIPEVFTEFLRTLLLIISVGLMLMGLSFIPNIALKKRYAFLLVGVSIFFVILVATAFFMGMGRITELSLGSLQGEGVIEVSPPLGGSYLMKANWGLDIGFYLIIVAALVSISAGIIDSLRRRGFLLSLSI